MWMKESWSFQSKSLLPTYVCPGRRAVLYNQSSISSNLIYSEDITLHMDWKGTTVGAPGYNHQQHILYEILQLPRLFWHPSFKIIPGPELQQVQNHLDLYTALN